MRLESMTFGQETTETLSLLTFKKKIRHKKTPMSNTYISEQKKWIPQPLIQLSSILQTTYTNRINTQPTLQTYVS